MPHGGCALQRPSGSFTQFCHANASFLSNRHELPRFFLKSFGQLGGCLVISLSFGTIRLLLEFQKFALRFLKLLFDGSRFLAVSAFACDLMQVMRR